MIYLKTPVGRKRIERLSGLCGQKAGIFFFVIPAAVVQMGLRAEFPHYLSWADFFYWICFFLIGFIFAGDPRFNEGVERNGWGTLILGIFTSFLLVYLVIGKGYIAVWEKNPQFGLGYLGYQALRSINTWSWIVFFLFLGLKSLNFRSSISDYCREAVLPFYILHQTVILAVGFWVIQWDLGVGVKYLIICGISFLLIMAIYEGVVKRTMPLRFLFGLKFRNISVL